MAHQQDIANDVVPRSPTVGDRFHLNTAGQKIVGSLIEEDRTRLGNDRNGQILTASIGPDPIYVPPYTPHTLTASSGITHRYLPGNYSTTAADTKMARIDNLVSGGEYLREVVAGPVHSCVRQPTRRTWSSTASTSGCSRPRFTPAQPYTAAIAYRLRSTEANRAVLSLANGAPGNPLLERAFTGNATMFAGAQICDTTLNTPFWSDNGSW
ncbi:hypothetical protein [Arthrobacter sp. NPDC092385]|uniref:hypothetical protein n=1 Tax=Arthrobacter sp. NPDC092385 TaxID=3363943 RepID=UPI003821A717